MPTESRRKLTADAWGSLLRVHATLVPVLDRELRERAALPLAWYDVLLELANADDGRLTMSTLGERVVLSRTRISRVVDELAAAGLVARTPHPSDGRSSYATITEAGSERFRRAAPLYLAALERQLGRALAMNELRALRDTLAAVAEHVG